VSNHVFPRPTPDPTEGEVILAATSLSHAFQNLGSPFQDTDIMPDIEVLMDAFHGDAVAAGWHHDISTGQPKARNFGEMLMLAVSELAEAMEGYRKKRMDDKLPHRLMLEVELADFVIRVCDTLMVLHGRHPDTRSSAHLPRLTATNVSAALMQIVGRVAKADDAYEAKHLYVCAHHLVVAIALAVQFATQEQLDLPGALVEKRAFNRVRKDHGVAARLADGGKAF
jgi:hypothetical protein